jgi:acyl-CoA thioester hydrolase
MTSPPTPNSPATSPPTGTTRLRARYCECDPMGVVHHAAYIPWLEIGRTELLRATGVSYAELERQGVLLVITKLECNYRRPAFYDDLLEIRTTHIGGSRVKIEHRYEIVLVEDGKFAGGKATAAQRQMLIDGADPLLTATSTLACLDATGRPQALPDWLAPHLR